MSDHSTIPASQFEPLPPVRGLILAQNARGHALSIVDLERWLRLNRMVYKTAKIDVVFRGLDVSLFQALVQAARPLNVELSVRTDCSSSPPPVETSRSLGAWDVFLCPAKPDAPQFDAWLATCHEAGIPVRVQFTGSFEENTDVQALANTLTRMSVTSVNLAAYDPFVAAAPARNAMHSQKSIERISAFAGLLDQAGCEVNLVNWPFCVVGEALWPFVLNSMQFHCDHQHYQRDAYGLARRMYGRHPARIRLALLMLLEQATSTGNPIDRILLPWIMERPWVRARVWAWHKLTRHRKQGMPASSVDPFPAAHSLEADRVIAARRSAKGPVCADCRFNRVCDGLTPELTKALPGLGITTQEGESILDPFLFSATRARYYDDLDAPRRERDAAVVELASRANTLVTNRAPDREVDSFDYAVDGTWSWPLPGCLRWFSFANCEKLSTPLARMDPPFTVSVTFGGGIAEFIGFSLGKGCRLLCPMIAYTHRLVLHVETDGQFVLLRDGHPVRPVDFAGTFYAPLRLGKGLEPRISIWNIDGTIGTQAVYLWQGEGTVPASASAPRFSIVMVSTRYARRLQASLESVAHQRGIALDEVEIVAAYVPGMDATGDVLESISLAHPTLTIVPTAFAAEQANAKGLMLNECLSKARGEWILIVDADILLAPDMLARLAALPDSCMFAIPDGRKMLDKETTARVLLGEARPWEQWQELLNGNGEYRMREADGVPVGYCQCVRHACLARVQYEEMNHFEGADWKFGKDMREAFGPETRLSGVPVLHLDHGSSNWYGAARHF
ncbi:MAG: glycosyltransferase [Candidatus Hydrogenedentes bacterium]|nr:glycosyltransferase [Candidatus Hydrogenedentota bacterium]